MNWIFRILRKLLNAQLKQGAGKLEPNLHNRNTTGVAVTADNPIRRQEDDVLGRAIVARSFARQVLSLDAREGIVVGVLGAWGYGKTSFINLARDEFDRAGVPGTRLQSLDVQWRSSNSSSRSSSNSPPS